MKLPNDNQGVCTFWGPGKVVETAQEGTIQYIDFKKNPWWGLVRKTGEEDNLGFNVVCYFIISFCFV